MGERATASDPFQSTDAECVRLPEENARLRQLLMEHKTSRFGQLNLW